MDNLDCQKSEVCLDQSDSPNGICFKPCAPLRIKIETNGTESYIGSSGDNVTRYKLKVTNWQEFDDYLFAPAPDLPACGLNANSSRSWIDIIDHSADRKIYGFCALTQAEGMTKLWFGIKQGSHPPQKVHITMIDRRTGRKYCSNAVSIQ